MTLNPEGQIAREKVLEILRMEKIESYVAYNKTKNWKHKGERDHVVPQPDLAAEWSIAGAGISYHHSHPDDRSLSPSDLRTLYKPGVDEIWAHCESGISYGARLANNVSRVQFENEHEHLNNAISEELTRAAARSAGVTLSGYIYRDLCDRAFCEALSKANLLDFEAVSLDGTALPQPSDTNYSWLVCLSGLIIARRYPPPAVT